MCSKIFGVRWIKTYTVSGPQSETESATQIYGIVLSQCDGKVQAVTNTTHFPHQYLIPTTPYPLSSNMLHLHSLPHSYHTLSSLFQHASPSFLSIMLHPHFPHTHYCASSNTLLTCIPLMISMPSPSSFHMFHYLHSYMLNNFSYYINFDTT